MNGVEEKKEIYGKNIIHSLDGKKSITAEEFDRLFDEGSDEIDEYIDWSKGTRPGRAVQRVNVDFPVPVIKNLDREAARIGVTRQSLIKLWISERLDAMKKAV